MLRTLYPLLTLAPAPAFFIGFLWSVINITHLPICGGHSWEMPLMWLIMCVAHITPWLLWFQQRNRTR